MTLKNSIGLQTLRVEQLLDIDREPTTAIWRVKRLAGYPKPTLAIGLHVLRRDPAQKDRFVSNLHSRNAHVCVAQVQTS